MQNRIMQGKIVKCISNLYTVEMENKLLECRPRGKFRKENLVPLVGDLCHIDKEQAYILEILPRKNKLERPAIANVDTALIVTSVKDPKLSLHLLDKMISIISMQSIEIILYFSKIDLLNEEEKELFFPLVDYYKKIGYAVFDVTKINELQKYLTGKTVVITGQTGAGKSSLLNRMDESLHLKTDEISKSLGRGKHTTRHVELFKVNACYIADTPGFSSLDFYGVSKENIRDSFTEFNSYACLFKDCMHNKEKECNVKKAVENREILKSRYENYIQFIKDK